MRFDLESILCEVQRNVVVSYIVVVVSVCVCVCVLNVGMKHRASNKDHTRTGRFPRLVLCNAKY